MLGAYGGAGSLNEAMNVETYRSPIRRSGEPPSGDQRALSDLSPAIYDLAQKLLRAHEQGGS